MVKLRIVTFVAVILCSVGAGVAGTAWRYALRIERLQEEREGYTLLANNAAAMSQKALTFAQGYQTTLEVCLTRLYTPTLMEAGLKYTLPKGKGGMGGPLNMRGAGKLP
jgi:hypothetical protein